MPAVDLLADAIATLYRTGFDDFIDRRNALVAQARKAGDKDSAQAIGRLKKPTRAAWIVNQLVHSDPEVPVRLAELATRLRAAERALDGPQMRSLTTEKNRLLTELTRAAFAATDQANPAASIADEVNSTLAAALADPAVAESLSQGTLLRSASWSGFGVSPPELSLVPSPARAANTPTTPRGPKKSTRKEPDPDEETVADETSATEEQATAQQHAIARQQEREEAERKAEQEDRANQLKAAEEAVTLADRRVAEADEQQSHFEETVERLSAELATARAELKAASLALREARSQRQTARQRFSRMR
jgi:hypothetical protein